MKQLVGTDPSALLSPLRQDSPSLLGAHHLCDWAFRIWRPLEFDLTNYRGSGILSAARATDSWEGSYGEDVQRRNKLESLQSKALFSPTISISSVLSLATGGLGSLGWLLAARAGPSSTVVQDRYFASSFTSPDILMPYSLDSVGRPFGTCMVTDHPAAGRSTTSGAEGHGNCAPLPVTMSGGHASWLSRVNPGLWQVNGR